MIVPNDILMEEVRRVLAQGSSVQIRAKGRSMRPTIKDGIDVLSIKHASPAELRRGDIVLAKTSAGAYVVHRLVAINGQEATLMGDGNLRGTEQCGLADIFGVVDGIIRGSRRINCNSGWQKAKARIIVPVFRFLRIIKSKLQ